MSRKVLKLKGLRTPKPLLFIYGFINGRMRTAAVDEQSGRLDSAYIYGSICRFDALCKKRVIQLDRKLSEERANAEALILELNTLRVPACQDAPAALPAPDTKLPASYAEAQAGRAAAAAAAREAAAASRIRQQQEEGVARRAWIVRRLIKIRETIALNERVCAEELSATADALRDRFCAYGHGAILRPIRESHMPVMEYQIFLAEHRADHEKLRQKITTALEKEAA